MTEIPICRLMAYVEFVLDVLIERAGLGSLNSGVSGGIAVLGVAFFIVLLARLLGLDGVKERGCCDLKQGLLGSRKSLPIPEGYDCIYM